ncbi:MAG: hypothetical protein ABI318_16075 [Chthoniobacteraceae bacterium]
MAFGLPAYKDIVDLMKKGATLEAQEKIMELREGALELQEENLRLKNELKNEKENIKALEQKLAFHGSLTFKKPFYFGENDPVPFCPICWEKNSKAIHLQGPIADDYYLYSCKVCNGDFVPTGNTMGVSG